jgi:hypothetical protein
MRTILACWLTCAGTFVSVAFSLSAQSKLDVPPKPIDTSVGELVANSDRFNGKTVRVRASFITDGLEHSSLEEPKCRLADALTDESSADPECKYGVVPWVRDEVEHHPDIEALDAALAKGRRGTIDKQIVATFTGRFICKPACSSRGGRILEIEQVGELKVTKVKSKKPTP